MRTAIIAAVCTLLAGAACADQTISESEVPKPALDGVTRKYPGAKKLGFERETEDGQTNYEVKLLHHDQRIDVEVAADGKIVSEETTISFDAAPEAVKQALAASPKYGKWTVRHTERVIQGENTAAPRYEIVVSKGKHKAELVFAADGKLLPGEE
jgi:hypothetical protein